MRTTRASSHGDESPAADFDYFTIYGSNANDFGAAVVVDFTTGESLDVSGSPYPFYFVTATDEAGNEGPPAQLNAPTGIGGIPSRYVLSVTNFPNPFNPSTRVRYTVPSTGAVKVSIFDVRGVRVKTLVDSPRHTAGAHNVEWYGRDDQGAAVASGVYFARIEHGAGTQSRKMLLLK